MTLSRSSAVPLLCLVLIVAVAGWGRLSQLGARDMWTDELNHHFAARSIAAGNGPLLPSGEPYVRGLPITRAIAFTQSRIDDPELAARLPSAGLGILNIVLIAAAAWMLAGPWTAVWAALLMALYPEAVGQSRNARFYTYQLNMGIAALLTGWFATRSAAGNGAVSRRELAIGWTAMLTTVALIVIGYRVQPTTLSIAVGFAAWVAFVAADDLRRRGRAAIRDSVALQAAGIGLIGLVVLLGAGIAGPMLRDWWIRANWTASWVGYSTGPRFFYVRRLAEWMPWVMSLLPILVLVAFRQVPRLTLYLLTWFVIPLALHSFLLPWKGERYFLLPLPALFVLAGIAGSHLLGVFDRGAGGWLAARGIRGARAIGRVLAAASALWAIVLLPGFVLLLRPGTEPNRTTRVAGEILAVTPEVQDIPWGSIDPLVALHFWKRVDFGVQTSLRDYARSPAPHHPAPRFPPSDTTLPRDFYTGVPLATSPERIRAAYGTYGAVVIGLFPENSTMLDSTLVSTLAREGRELCLTRCGPFRLYVWHLSTPDSEEDR